MGTTPTTAKEEAALITALVKARADFRPIRKTKTNPHFKSKFAPLDEIISATEEALAKNGLSITQTFDGDAIITTLWHTSGASIDSRLTLPAFSKMPDLGSNITYARRYCYAAILCVTADEDTDGNGGGQAGNGVVTTGTTGPDPGAPATPSNADATRKQYMSGFFARLKDAFGGGGVWDKDEDDEYTETSYRKQDVWKACFGDVMYKDVQTWAPQKIADTLAEKLAPAIEKVKARHQAVDADGGPF